MGRDEKMSKGSTIHENIRSLLLDHIEENPGISFQVLMSVFKVPDGTLRHHLRQLQKSKKIISEKKKKHRCYYSYLVKRFPLCKGKIDLNREQERLLDIIIDRPGITRKELMNASNLTREEMTYNIKRLKDHKLIWKVSVGEKKGYEPLNEESVKGEMFRVLVKRLVDGDLDRETFFELMREIEEQK